MDVCFLDVVEEGCFTFGVLALTPWVMRAGGEGAFENFENGICVREGGIVVRRQGGGTLGGVGMWGVG